jgi:hypothetical protein
MSWQLSHHAHTISPKPPFDFPPVTGTMSAAPLSPEPASPSIHMHRRLLLLFAALLPLLLPSCETTGGSDNGPEVQMRNAAILAEPRGDWYIGRRYFTNKVRYWGYLRRPGQLWDDSKLVIMDEVRGILTPDRLPEAPAGGGQAHGYDHNYEYRIWGNYTGQLAYDPNSDRELPVFAVKRYEVISTNPGFLFSPRDRYNRNYIPAREGKYQTPNRL